MCVWGGGGGGGGVEGLSGGGGYSLTETIFHFVNKSTLEPQSYHFRPGLDLPRPKAIVVIPKNQPLPKHLR